MCDIVSISLQNILYRKQSGMSEKVTGVGIRCLLKCKQTV